MNKKIGFILLGAIVALSSCKKEERIAEATIIQESTEKSQTKDNSLKITEESVMKLDEEDYDFKEIKKGEKVSHVFFFTNKGQRPLIISEVRPSCGCTTPKYTKTPVYPRARGSITVTFDSSSFDEGMIYKTVAVSGNFETKIIKFQAKIN